MDQRRQQIVVIADDLSGAAELAGIAAARGLLAEVQTHFAPDTNAQVIALDTQSRSLTPAAAAARIRRIARAVCAASPAWIYKKTDSVLRGNVRHEIEALVRAASYRGALFVPANPTKQRTLRAGRYFIRNIPLHQTLFAHDPEYPRQSDAVVDLLSPRGSLPLQILASAQRPRGAGIFIPDATNSADLEERARTLPRSILAAGAADFFAALLRHRLRAAKPRRTRLASVRSAPELQRALFVCGSAAAWNQGIAATARARGIPVVRMPRELFKRQRLRAFELWVRRVERALESAGAAVIAIGSSNARPARSRSTRTGSSRAHQRALAGRLVRAAATLLASRAIARLCVEGGATATALIRQLGWDRFGVEPCSWVGVGALRPIGAPTAPLLLIKPGSYPWPNSLWRLLSQRQRAQKA